MKKEQKNKKQNLLAGRCFLIASICYYISAIIAMASKGENNWISNMCLGSAFLCISTAYLNKNEDNTDEDNDNENNDNEDNEDK